MSLCAYKDIFGKAGEGIHSTRIFKTKTFKGFAFYDILFTILGSILITFLIKSFSRKESVIFLFLKVTFFLFLLGYILHKIFCVY